MFTLANVERVYSGKPGCMCGCRGKYSISQRSVKILFNKVMGNPKHKMDGNIAYVETATRNLVVYFKD
jgi:hypothetical protein